MLCYSILNLQTTTWLAAPRDDLAQTCRRPRMLMLFIHKSISFYHAYHVRCFRPTSCIAFAFSFYTEYKTTHPPHTITIEHHAHSGPSAV
ncbi:hypothetical protein VTL71DRAFT_13773 [Oculimacula yallundae]|uniref:Secreted protein n=1 Tax=Oculimacula yallundae TaxID=86028 RepID=A0ABR4CLB9_9HELO